MENLIPYEIGGIFNAIKQNKDEVCEDSNEDTDLTELFSFKPQENQDEAIPDDDQLEKFINPTEEEAVPSEPIKKKKKNKQKEDGSKVETTDDKDEVKKKKVLEDESPERKARTIFVGNIALNVSKKDLKKIFSKFGEVETIRIRSIPRADTKTSRKVSFIRKEFHSERDSMNAYVVYKEKDNANKALQCNGMLLENMHLRVDLSENKKHDTSATIFVGNLPFKINEEKLREHFTKCGEVDDVRVIRDKATGMGKGFAYVRFKSKDSVMFGLKMNSSEFEGRKIRVFKAKDGKTEDQTNKVRKNKKFQGLRSTSKKDIEMGKKLFTTGTNKKNSLKKQNAMKRIKNKNVKKQKVDAIRKHNKKKEKKKK